jgi:hypothetical protein
MSRVFKPTDTLEDLLLDHYGWTEVRRRPGIDKLEFVMEFDNGSRRRYVIVTHLDNDLIPKYKH